jgi:hypothetical protein
MRPVRVYVRVHIHAVSHFRGSRWFFSDNYCVDALYEEAHMETLEPELDLWLERDSGNTRLVANRGYTLHDYGIRTHGLGITLTTPRGM